MGLIVPGDSGHRLRFDWLFPYNPIYLRSTASCQNLI